MPCPRGLLPNFLFLLYVQHLYGLPINPTSTTALPERWTLCVPHLPKSSSISVSSFSIDIVSPFLVSSPYLSSLNRHGYTWSMLRTLFPFQMNSAPPFPSNNSTNFPFHLGPIPAFYWYISGSRSDPLSPPLPPAPALSKIAYCKLLWEGEAFVVTLTFF